MTVAATSSTAMITVFFRLFPWRSGLSHEDGTDHETDERGNILKLSKEYKSGQNNQGTEYFHMDTHTFRI